MIQLSDQEFEQLITDAMNDLASKVADHMDNVAVVWDDEPSQEQRTRMKLDDHHTLFGLYEGIPLPSRGSNYNLVLPDKITIFKKPILAACSTLEQVRREVHNTVWHEIAHHYGLGHDQIEQLEHRQK